MTVTNLAERGRRAGAAALLVIVSAGVAQTILANPEPVPALTIGLAPTSTAAPPGAASSPTASTSTATPKVTAATAAMGTVEQADPRALAVAWYADRHGISPSKVKALQADKLKGAAYRVLLMVSKPSGRLDSAVVKVTRSGDAWRVEAGRG
jgi:hypothetical protein